ncbi:hypothetical protein Mgra_00000638 [Meloidogyne graminicola]|uniref:Uncharacterized protein n=1 Tax=Meloidogyne graminicola TaxID=189291 RepID=A0A8T0A1M1_9BILA|nr:hypothetical protein Mgra_00000638 [Meloidogyne graminicola]
MSSSSPPPNNFIFLPSQSPPNIFQKINENQFNLNFLNYLFFKNYNQQQNNNNNELIIKEEEKQTKKINETTKMFLNLQQPNNNNNIILLPVGCHSLNDENHIQLLGTPQTIIPIAVHSKMLNNFPINPLLLESSTKILLENCCELNKNQNLCHLPIAIKQLNQENNLLKKENNTTTNNVSCQTEEFSFSSSFFRLLLLQIILKIIILKKF